MKKRISQIIRALGLGKPASSEDLYNRGFHKGKPHKGSEYDKGGHRKPRKPHHGHFDHDYDPEDWNYC